MKWFFKVFLLFVAANCYGASKAEQLCDSPRIYYYTRFLSPEECDKVIQQARPLLYRSMVVTTKGEEMIDPRRTSEGMFFSSNPTESNLRSIEKKIAKVTNLPIENGEAIQVLHYQTGAEYQPHYDYFILDQPGGKECLERGGQRVASFLIFLNTPEKGGETIFPRASISVSPKKGDALLFYNVTSSGKIDPQSLHGGAPVLAGEKWLLTKWIRESKFQ